MDWITEKGNENFNCGVLQILNPLMSCCVNIPANSTWAPHGNQVYQRDSFVPATGADQTPPHRGHTGGQ